MAENTPNQIPIELIAKLDSLKSGLKEAESELKKFQSKSEDASKKSNFKLINTDKIQESLQPALTKLGQFSPALETVGSGFVKLATGPIGVTALALAAFGKATAEAFQLAKQGEEEAAIGKRFELLATQAGLFPEALKSGIEKAIGGTVDLDDALGKANQSLIELSGASSAQIAQLFKLGKQTAEVFGGDTLANVDKLSGAIASGSSKALKSLGIQVDLTKAQKDYAKELGTTTQFLTQEEKQQANLNAVLAKGETSFKNISASVTPIKTNLSIFNTSVKDLGDSFAELANKLFGGVFTKALDAAASGVRSLNRSFREASGLELPSLSTRIDEVSKRLSDLNNIKAGGGVIDASLSLQISKATKELRDLEAAQERQFAAEERINQRRVTALNGTAPQGRVKTDEELAFLKEQQDKKDQLLISAKAKEISIIRETENFKIAELLGASATEESIKQAGLLKEEQARRDHEQKLLDLKKEFRTKDVVDLQTYKNLQAAEDARYDAEKVSQKKATEDKIKSIQQASNVSLQQLAAQGADEFRKYGKISQATFDKVGKAAEISLKEGVAKSFTAVAEAIGSGGDPLKAFAGAFLKSIGEMASAQGQLYVLQGVGMLWTGNPAGAGVLAAGVGLTALGIALSAAGQRQIDASKSASQQAAAQNFAQPAGGDSSVLNSNTPFEDAQRNDPAQRVNVVFAGPVFDQDQTAEVLADILSNGIAKKGIKINVA